MEKKENKTIEIDKFKSHFLSNQLLNFATFFSNNRKNFKFYINMSFSKFKLHFLEKFEQIAKMIGQQNNLWISIDFKILNW